MQCVGRSVFPKRLAKPVYSRILSRQQIVFEIYESTQFRPTRRNPGNRGLLGISSPCFCRGSVLQSMKSKQTVKIDKINHDKLSRIRFNHWKAQSGENRTKVNSLELEDSNRCRSRRKRKLLLVSKTLLPSPASQPLELATICHSCSSVRRIWRSNCRLSSHWIANQNPNRTSRRRNRVLRSVLKLVVHLHRW